MGRELLLLAATVGLWSTGSRGEDKGCTSSCCGSTHQVPKETSSFFFLLLLPSPISPPTRCSVLEFHTHNNSFIACIAPHPSIRLVQRGSWSQRKVKGARTLPILGSCGSNASKAHHRTGIVLRGKTSSSNSKQKPASLAKAFVTCTFLSPMSTPTPTSGLGAMLSFAKPAPRRCKCKIHVGRSRTMETGIMGATVEVGLALGFITELAIIISIPEASTISLK